MLQTIEVEIDAQGRVHPVGMCKSLPAGRALLTPPANEEALLSERGLAKTGRGCGMGLLAAGQVVVLPFPFSDLSRNKYRPALILADAGRGDWIACQITSKPYADHRADRRTPTGR